jgi:hypothetical protein
MLEINYWRSFAVAINITALLDVTLRANNRGHCNLWVETNPICNEELRTNLVPSQHPYTIMLCLRTGTTG